MVFQRGADPNRGPGRAPGQKTKRTQMLDGLKLIYGKDALSAFIAQLAQQAKGLTEDEAVVLSTATNKVFKAQLPCLASQRMLLDRLVPALKAIEVKADGGELQVLLKQYVVNHPEMPESASIAPKLVEAPKVEVDEEVTPDDAS